MTDRESRSVLEQVLAQDARGPEEPTLPSDVFLPVIDNSSTQFLGKVEQQIAATHEDIPRDSVPQTWVITGYFTELP